MPLFEISQHFSFELPIGKWARMLLSRVEVVVLSFNEALGVQGSAGDQQMGYEIHEDSTGCAARASRRSFRAKADVLERPE